MSSHASDASTPDRGRLPHHREAPFQAPDPSTPAGEQILRRLREELFLWFTTVDATGAPHSLPVAFLWDEAQSTFLISSTAEEDRDRLIQMQQNPKVGLHFNLDMSGADSFILTGEARISENEPSFDQMPAWVAKYQAFFAQVGLTIQQAAVVSPVALRVRPLTMVARYGGAMEEQ